MASAELPLSSVKDEDFEEFIQVVFCPQFKKPSKNTTRANCMKVFYTIRQSLIEGCKALVP